MPSGWSSMAHPRTRTGKFASKGGRAASSSRAKTTSGTRSRSAKPPVTRRVVHAQRQHKVNQTSRVQHRRAQDIHYAGLARRTVSAMLPGGTIRAVNRLYLLQAKQMGLHQSVVRRQTAVRNQSSSIAKTNRKLASR